ncbi:MAG: hypothetical protein ABIV63_11705 [Caldimonas sp.]
MRAAPPIQVTPQRFGVWRGAVTLLAIAGAAAIALWTASHARPVDAVTWTIAVLAWAGIAVAAGSALRVPPLCLSWDGRAWHLGPIDAEPQPGKLRVALDLGAWMLLRFESITPRRRTTWLPLQRRGLEADWHALRCAVYSPQPAPRADEAEA